MFHGHLDYFQKPPLGGRPNIKLGDHGTPNAYNRWFVLFYHVWGSAWIEIPLKYHLVEGPVMHDITLHLSVCDHTTWFWSCVGRDGLWTLYVGRSQFRGHGSWLVCEVVLRDTSHHEPRFVIMWCEGPWFSSRGRTTCLLKFALSLPLGAKPDTNNSKTRNIVYSMPSRISCNISSMMKVCWALRPLPFQSMIDPRMEWSRAICLMC